MHQHEKINYLEFPSRDLEETKAFFSTVFAWAFVDYGADYVAFSNAGMDGGFYKSECVASSVKGGALVVFYSHGLSETQAKIEAAGGSILQPVFSFPGGCRFHFSDLSGNEFAVWSDV